MSSWIGSIQIWEVLTSLVWQRQHLLTLSSQWDTNLTTSYVGLHARANHSAMQVRKVIFRSFPHGAPYLPNSESSLQLHYGTFQLIKIYLCINLISLFTFWPLIFPTQNLLTFLLRYLPSLSRQWLLYHFIPSCHLCCQWWKKILVDEKPS